MSWFLMKTAVLLTIFMPRTKPARILGVYPIPSISHQVVFRAISLELVRRGHEVMVITTDPICTEKQHVENLTQIDLSNSYDIMKHLTTSQEVRQNIMKRGVILDVNAVIRNDDVISLFIKNLFASPAVKTIINEKKYEFDLIMVEGIAYAPLIFSEIFNAPVVLISSSYGTASNYEIVGAISRHPILYPHVLRNKFRILGMFDKLEQLYLEYKIWKYERHCEITEDILLKSLFGSNVITVAELKKRVSLLLVNAHPIFDGNRPVPPGTVYLGAAHLQPIKELPQDLKSYLDSSSRGVVYVSLGTNVSPSMMDKDFLDAFLDAFKMIPYDILWKYDGDALDGLPENVQIQKWFPQRDLLGHPNIKVFVMQGGLQSTDEAVDAEVPLVGIPMLGDQWYNINKFVELGIGVYVDSITMVADDLVKAVNIVANEPSYKENMKKLKAIMQDQPQKPVDRAVWWIEHVLRHNGSRHLIGPSATLSTSEYYMLDVLITLAVLFAITVLALHKFSKFVTRMRSCKVKQY